MKFWYYSFFVIATAVLHAQNHKIAGVVLDQGAAPLPFVTILIAEDSSIVQTDLNGNFHFESSLKLPLHLSIKHFGFNDTIIEIASTFLKINLSHKPIQLHEVELTYESQTEKLSKEGYSINAIETKQYANSSTDVNQILNRSTGVNIRQRGGLGSQFEFSINGLSGKQVKMFYDGIPMDYMGTAFTLNNIPPNMIERIEVYKGVVPVTLGADALGGAVNIVPKDAYSNYLDASYSYGSFNTHRASVNAQYIHPKTNFVAQATGVYNYSNNNYKIDATKPDYSTGQDGEVKEYERFHDGYKSYLTQIQVGFVNKKYADKLMIGFNYADSYKEVQHSNTIDHVFGQVHYTDETVMPTILYKKEQFLGSKFDLKFYAGYIERSFQLTDTSSKTYYWDGSYEDASNTIRGELGLHKSLFSYKDKSFYTISTIDYRLDNNNIFTLNHTFNHLTRNGEDPIATEPIPFDEPNTMKKHVLGFNYKKVSFKEKLTTNVFLKTYFFQGAVSEAISLSPAVYQNVTSKESKTGYGFATTYALSKNLRSQFSFEKAYRFPESYELFGDGVLLENNSELVPESSNNFNLGLQYIKKTDSSAFTVGTNFFYRYTKDMIRLMPGPRYSQYKNLANVLTTGVEIESNYEDNRWLLGINATYQHLINTNEFVGDRPNPVYKDIIPNTPYLFGNISVGYQLPVISKKNKIRMSYYLRYVNEYYLYWPSQGSSEDKFVIPSQMTHNAEIIYSINQGLINIALECQNLLDAKTYDHFRIQRPGRAFYLKLRYNWNK